MTVRFPYFLVEIPQSGQRMLNVVFELILADVRNFSRVTPHEVEITELMRGKVLFHLDLSVAF